MGAAPNDEQAELMEAKRALMATRGELLKAQIVAATRHDVIRMLGFISNRPAIPDLSAILPAEPEMRAVFASELRDLAAHMRAQAVKYEGLAVQLEAPPVNSDGFRESV